MADAPSRAFAAEIAALHAVCEMWLDSSRPTHLRRRDYQEALGLADATAQLAAEAAAPDAEVVAACDAMQGRCEDVLRRWYDAVDQREKDNYARAVADATRLPGTRPARRRSAPETQLSSASAWWLERAVAVVDGDLHPAIDLPPAERRSVIRDMRVRLSMAAGLPYRGR